MSSSRSTIKKSQHANGLFKKEADKHQIASNLKVSVSRIEEYLERNSHPTSCPICHGNGVKKQRKTALKTPICGR